MNDLKKASSPYLLEHAENPVNWMEWGEEALNKAKNENKPLIVSIGYSACHWCHVMADESFNDPDVAQLMNENFVPVKVDREEHPDIDQVYMDAATMLNGQGGWPLNAFAFPDGRPFFAGVYFPKNQWVQLLEQAAKLYNEQYEELLKQAGSIEKGLDRQKLIHIEPDEDEFLPEGYGQFYENLKKRLDFNNGGMKGSPKFPMPIASEFLLENYYLTQNKEALKAVELTLEQMAKGGIYDQIGGGFARYSTDKHWFVPHFEKMLYDNGQLVSLYAKAYKITGNPLYEEVIRESLAFVERELQTEEGGFYSSLNADSEGEEGKYYVFGSEEFDQILDGKTAGLIKKYYGLKKGGNWENGQNILYRTHSKKEFAAENSLELKDWEKQLREGGKKLLDYREKRERPSTDDKILTSWNALMLKAYIDAYQALGEENYLREALKNAGFLEKNMMKENGQLFRNYKNGTATIDAFLDDYALLAEAYLDLYQVTFDKHWLDLAQQLVDYALGNFSGEKRAMLYYSTQKSGGLFTQKKEVTDNVMPSSNSVFGRVLFRLGTLTENEDYQNRSRQMLQEISKTLDRLGPYGANWMRLYGLLVYEPYEIAIMGKAVDEKKKALQKNYWPTALFLGGTEENLPLLENKKNEGKTTIYVCRNHVCKEPVEKVEAAVKQMEKG